MFERFTERARQVVVLAQEEARQLRHEHIGTEHLLLGLLREEHIAAHVLEAFDVTIEEARAQVSRVVGVGDKAPVGQIPFTPRAKHALELSLREALSLGQNHIEPEHILLGLVQRPDSAGARILADFDLDAETLRNEVVRALRRGHGIRPWPATEGESMMSVEVRPEPAAAPNLRIPLIVAIALATAAFPLGLLFGWLIWG